MTLRILHLSDLHFRATHKDPLMAFNADIITTSMIASIERIVQSGNTIDIIIITGDIAFSGKEEEYEVAKTFCQRLLDVTELPNNRLFIVPGNHDVDRAYINKWQLKGIYSFDSQEEINRILSDKDAFTILMRKFLDFNTFANLVAFRSRFLLCLPFFPWFFYH